jgi:hypothetical protein
VQGKPTRTLMRARAANASVVNSKWKSNRLIASAMSHSVCGMLSRGSQQGMLAPGGATGMLIRNGQPPQAQSGARTNPGSKVMLNPQLLPPRQMLTHADVIKMVRGGLPESVIAHTIQSAGRNFDFSPAGCRALQAAHVSRQALDAMGGGSARPCRAGMNPARGHGTDFRRSTVVYGSQTHLAERSYK